MSRASTYLLRIISWASFMALHTLWRTIKNSLPHEIFFYRYTRVLLDELHDRDLKQDQERYPFVALFLDSKIQQANRLLHSIMSLFTSSVLPFDYDRAEISKKRKQGLRCGRSVPQWTLSDMSAPWRSFPSIKAFYAGSLWRIFGEIRAYGIKEKDSLHKTSKSSIFTT